MKQDFFSPLAEQRLMSLFPQDGSQRFKRLISFMSIAALYSGTPLVVPPSVDVDLHEVLCARDENGDPFEKCQLEHALSVILGPTKNESLQDLDHPMAQKTLALLEKHGFKLGDEKYQTQACILKFL